VIVDPAVDAVLAEIEAGPGGPHIGAFFDFDGTLIDGYSFAAFYEHRLRRGEVNAMEVLQLLSVAAQGELTEESFTQLAQQAGKAWAGRSEDDMAELGQRLLVKRLGGSLYPAAWEIVQAHHRQGHTVVLTSAATRFQVEPMARELGVEHILCTELEAEDGMLTGRLRGRPPWGSGKVDAVAKFAVQRGLDLGASHGYANGDEDIPFLELVGHPYAVNPHRRLAAAAAERGWPVLRFPARGRPGPVQVVRSVYAYAAALGAASAGIGVGLLNRSRREGIDVGVGLGADLALSVAGVRLEVQGAEYLWSHRPAVFIFNHQSGIDVLILAKLLRHGFTGVAKREAARIPGFGQAFRLAGVAFVDRGNTSQAKAALAPAVETLRNGISLVISPEGTRSVTPRLGPFKKGAFHMAMQAEVPIVPIVIRNAGEVMWRTSKTIRPGTLDVVVQPPIPVDGWTVDDLDSRVAEVRKLFVDTLCNWPGRREARGRRSE
jgi:HAD superfamily hydrolase (TIGR01490 family)